MQFSNHDHLSAIMIWLRTIVAHWPIFHQLLRSIIPKKALLTDPLSSTVQVFHWRWDTVTQKTQRYFVQQQTFIITTKPVHCFTLRKHFCLCEFLNFSLFWKRTNDAWSKKPSAASLLTGHYLTHFLCLTVSCIYRCWLSIFCICKLLILEKLY